MTKSTQFSLVVCAFVVFTLSLGVVVDAKKKVPPSPPPAFPFITCPSSPLDKCDFYLSFYKTKIPTFTIRALSSDKLLSQGVVTTKGGLPVVTASTSGMCYFIPENSKTGKCGASFYFRGKTLKGGKWDVTRANMIAARTVVNANLNKYKNKCVALPVSTATIQTVPKRGKVPAKYQYLNPNSLLAEYPKNRRCVVFKTTA